MKALLPWEIRIRTVISFLLLMVALAVHFFIFTGKFGLYTLSDGGVKYKFDSPTWNGEDRLQFCGNFPWEQCYQLEVGALQESARGYLKFTDYDLRSVQMARPSPNNMYVASISFGKLSITNQQDEVVYVSHRSQLIRKAQVNSIFNVGQLERISGVIIGALVILNVKLHQDDWVLVILLGIIVVLMCVGIYGVSFLVYLESWPRVPSGF